MPPQISLNTLYELKNKKEKNKNNTYDEIIKKCQKKKACDGGLNIIYKIPYVIIGKPLYKIDDCIVYVVNALKKNGLYIRQFTPPHHNYIYISWNPSELNEQKRLK